MRIFNAIGCMLLLGLGAVQAQYQNIVIQDKAGYEQRVPLVNLQKLTFDEPNMIVNYVGDSTKTHSLESINKLYFKTTASDVNERNEALYDFTVFPNPSMESLIIKGIEKFPAECTIYNISGEKIKTIELNNDMEMIQTGELNIGIYFIKINNQIRKFEKQ